MGGAIASQGSGTSILQKKRKSLECQNQTLEFQYYMVSYQEGYPTKEASTTGLSEKLSLQIQTLNLTIVLQF